MDTAEPNTSNYLTKGCQCGPQLISHLAACGQACCKGTKQGRRAGSKHAWTKVPLLLPAWLLVFVRLRGGGRRLECHGANSHRAIACTVRQDAIDTGFQPASGVLRTPPSWQGAEGTRARRLSSLAGPPI